MEEEDSKLGYKIQSGGIRFKVEEEDSNASHTLDALHTFTILHASHTLHIMFSFFTPHLSAYNHAKSHSTEQHAL